MKKLIAVGIAVVALVGLTYLVKPKPLPPQQALYPVAEELRGETVVLEDYVRYPGEEDRTALELLVEVAGGEVGAKQYDFGVFVESIKGVKPDENHFWKLYYNGAEAQVGAGDLVTQDGDTLEWVMAKIDGTEGTEE